MKIRILSQYFYPDVASTGQLLTELSLGLVNEKIDVEVITALPYYEKKIPALRYEEYNLIKISRMNSFRFNKNTKFGQICNSVSFSFASLLKIIFSKSKSPLLIVSNPPFLPFLGFLAFKLKKIKYVYLIHDVFPEKAVKLNYLNSKSILYKIWRWADKKVLQYVSEIIVLSPSMHALLRDKLHSILEDQNKQISIIHNWADKEFIKPLKRDINPFIKKYKLQNKFIVSYSGNLGASYQLEFILDAASKINDEDVIFLFIGSGVKKKSLIKKKDDLKLQNVIFLPYQEKKILPFSISSASLSVIPYDKNLEGLLMPSKLYTNLAAGVPIVGVCGPDSDLAKIIYNAECGFVINENENELIYKINQLKTDHGLWDNLSRNARNFFEKNYTFEHSLKYYIEVIKRVN